jgi:hypothetical protein
MVTPDLLLLLIRFAENVPSAKQKKARKGKERQGKKEGRGGVKEISNMSV